MITIGNPVRLEFMQLTEKTITDNLDVLFYLEGKEDSGRDIYAYVTVAQDDLPEFLEKSQQYGFRPAEYGTIVLSGQGQPTDDEKDELEERLGLEHGVL